jgi:hypothetical protein
MLLALIGEGRKLALVHPGQRLVRQSDLLRVSAFVAWHPQAQARVPDESEIVTTKEEAAIRIRDLKEKYVSNSNRGAISAPNASLCWPVGFGHYCKPADQLKQRSTLRSRIACFKKVYDLDSSVSAGGSLVRFMQDKNPISLIAAQQPTFVALTINPALARHRPSGTGR